MTVYDPCCGSGGMLSIAKEHIAGGAGKSEAGVRKAINPEAQVHLFGQEVNPETWAVSKSDMLMLHPDGHDADNIAFGSTLSSDRHAGLDFDYLITNPPYGKDWKRDEEAVRAEARPRDRRALRPRLAAHQRRPDALPPAYARAHERS